MSAHPLGPQLRKQLRYHALFRPLAALPAALAYRAAAAIGSLDKALNASQAKRVADGLTKVFPRLADNPRHLEHLVQRHFQMLARETLDVFRMPRIGQQDGIELMRLTDIAPLAQAEAEGKGTILIMSHYSRLNMLLLRVALAGHPLGMLTVDISERNPALSPVDRRFLQRKVGNLLSHIGGRWVTLGDDMRGLYKGLKQGETIVMLMDAYNPQFQLNRSYPFLGGRLRLADGIERIAARTGARLLYGSVHEQGWRLNVELTRLPDDPAEAMGAAVALLENKVREMPWQWWQWGIIDRLWKRA